MKEESISRYPWADFGRVAVRFLRGELSRTEFAEEYWDAFRRMQDLEEKFSKEVYSQIASLTMEESNRIWHETSATNHLQDVLGELVLDTDAYLAGDVPEAEFEEEIIPKIRRLAKGIAELGYI